MQLKKNTRESIYAHTPAGSADNPDASSDESYYGDLPVPPVRSARAGAAEQQEHSRAASAVRAESVIDVHSTFDGRYETDHDLRVEGTISGEVVCRGTLTIERDATANAKIEARDAAIRGRVDGEILCTARLLLTGTAVVTGTLKAGTLVVEEGATVRGNVETLQEEAAVPAPVTRTSRAAGGEAKPSEEAPREPPSVASLPARNAGRGREVPSFALVSSEDRAGVDRN